MNNILQFTDYDVHRISENITCVFIQPIPRSYRTITMETLKKIPDLIEIDHCINVYAFPMSFIPCINDGSVCCLAGLFVYTPSACEIWLSKDKSPDIIEHTILHEFVHYEQWRDGKAVTEYGVERRVRTLQEEIW